MTLPFMAEIAKQKGLDLIAAPDFLHPLWREEMREQLTEIGEGVFQAHGMLFVLTVEVSCTFRQDGQGRRVHLLVTAPSFEAAGRLCKELERQGTNLISDGRPTLRMSAAEFIQLCINLDERFEIIPPHIWTPWFGIFGSRSGFDSLEECLGETAERVHILESGLSTDPLMNWGVSELETRTIVAFSDAHSPGTMGREATIVEIENEPNYNDIIGALRGSGVVETIEVHPQHGKYYHDGHRKCGFRSTPEETDKLQGLCVICKKPVTRGVLGRVQALSKSELPKAMKKGCQTFSMENKPSFRTLVPLRDLAASAMGTGSQSRKTANVCKKLIDALGSELRTLTEAHIEDVSRLSDERVAMAIAAVRDGHVKISPGFDGQYGTVRPVLGD